MSLGGTDLNLLVALHALLEEVNVTRAGDRVGMTQPAMSAALARLRRHYGDDLLVRVGRGYELTPLARALLPEVQRSIPLIEAAFELSETFTPATSCRRFTIAMSDYALAVLHRPLAQRVAAAAPGVSLDFRLLPADQRLLEHVLLEYDFVVAPHGYELAGRSRTMFRDRFVCVVDAENPRLVDGMLAGDDFEKLPHAVAGLGADPALVDRELSARGIARSAPVRTYGWLTLPFLVAGTDLVAILPERLAERTRQIAAVAVVPFPFTQTGLINSLWWHANRESDEGHAWLLGVLAEVADEVAELKPAQAGPDPEPIPSDA